MANVTKQELIQNIEKNTGVQASSVRRIVDALFEGIEKSLAQNARLEIRGFGSLFMKRRKAKLVRNPQKPQDTKILPERWSPVLKFSPEIKAEINARNGSNVEKKGEYYFITALRDFVDTEIESVNSAIENLVQSGAKNIAVNFNNVRYIYSPGLSMLVRMSKNIQTLGGQFCIVNIKPTVLTKMESVNLSKAIPLFQTQENFERENQVA